MSTKHTIKSQYHATLEMLRQAIVKCPESLWHDRGYNNMFWHIAYHALFYTHLYLQASEEDFVPWAKHRGEYRILGTRWPRRCRRGSRRRCLPQLLPLQARIARRRRLLAGTDTTRTDATRSSPLLARAQYRARCDHSRNRTLHESGSVGEAISRHIAPCQALSHGRLCVPSQGRFPALGQRYGLQRPGRC